ncbi:MAG: HNH endonuclease [Eubacteriaceae bacterium]|nr:HNH endonuclease [Eubacteriaceae bacterium]
MKAFIGVTDHDWFQLLRSQLSIEEVNFWQPSGNQLFKALKPGELFLFKLHSPNNFIVGGGFFAHSSLLPISMAWEAFGIANGATSFFEMKERVAKYRRQTMDRHTDYRIGCILLEQPFFLPEQQWIPAPSDWSPNIVQGKGYDLTKEPGLSLWEQLESPLPQAFKEDQPKYGTPMLTYPRLGQGSFRVLVTDAYERRCALTNERTLPALEAAHIRPFADKGEHRIENGILLRRDLHALFDRGYITINPDLHIEVSGKIKEEFENGRDYYRLHGTQMRPPVLPYKKPSDEYLKWHNDEVYLG